MSRIFFSKDMPTSAANLQVVNKNGDTLSLWGDDSCGTMSNLGRLDMMAWDKYGIDTLGLLSGPSAEGFMSVLAAHLGYVALPDNPTHPLGPTIVTYALSIEVVTKGRPSTEHIVGAFRDAGMPICQEWNMAYRHNVRVLEVFEYCIPGPDDTIHMVTIHTEVTMPNQTLDWDRIARAVEDLYGPNREYSVQVRMCVDTHLDHKSFNAKQKEVI